MSPNDYVEGSANVREFQHFLDGAIHGFRARLRDVSTSAGMLGLRFRDRLDDDGRALLETIVERVNELDQFTRALSDYALALGRPRISATGPMPVENALEHAKANLRKRIQERGASIYAGPLPKLEADHDELNVLFRCLLSNALEFPSEAPLRIEITATAAGGDWRFAISDNGMGVAPRFHRRIFEPFERLHSDRPGFGLGLAIARKIVAAHGGRLWIDSKEGEGSTFFFTLPKSDS